MGRNRPTAVLAAVFAAAAVAACGNVPIHSPAEEPPLFQRIDARVGTAYASAARLAFVTNPLMRIDVGQASVAYFESAFSAMFTEAVKLPDWPPWRHAAPRTDGVIELERADAELVLGDERDRPDLTSITYRVCLYEPNGTEIRCWTPSARSTHQRGAGQCLDLRECIVPQMEIVMREAIAVFLVAAERDPAVRDWAARLRGRPATP